MTTDTHAIEVTATEAGKVLEIRVTGKLNREVYEVFAPRIEELIQEHGKVSVLFDMHDFHGWTAGALWEDLKFDLKHFSDIERLALVGESKWEKGMAAFCKPFTSAKIRYFDRPKLDEARTWVRGEDA